MKILLFILVVIGIILVSGQSVVAEMSESQINGCNNLKLSKLSMDSEVTAGDELSCSFTVENMGEMVSLETPIQVTFRNKGIVELSDTVPPINPGKSSTVTIDVPIPEDISGLGSFEVIVGSSDVSPECYGSRDTIGNILRVLPAGMSVKDYDKKTTTKVTKVKATSKQGIKWNKKPSNKKH
ncbi:MAG: hypothetical protein JXA44_03065 [Methanospirillaceae archaeon]|nr:hypothetical protein [Methanospirillaceae archaeon]